MNEKTNEQVNSGTPESTVENEKRELAGFDSEQALVKAYKSLQSEFTKRSQKLKSAQELILKRTQATSKCLLLLKFLIK